MTMWTFTMDVEVDDEQQLWDAAILRLQGDGLTFEEAVDLVGERSKPSIRDCLLAVLDHGFVDGLSIHESDARRTDE